ncbi:MAG TPA: DUF1552 domain-containing protein [Planctomycetota bacterium]|nr:DUF1552 domain-containing protein [Planctomycetota bacterium]
MLKISRRTILQGMGAAVGLPFLEAMLPLRLGASIVSAGKDPIRMGFVMFPNGANMEAWMPAATGPLALSETLAPLKNVKDHVLVLSGLMHDKAAAHGDGPGDHARANAVFLTGAHPVKTEGKDIRAGVSIDQFAAQQIGEETRIPSLELGLEKGGNSGNCDSGYSCAYTSSISWRTPTSPMGKEVNPRAVFEKIFGDPGNANAKRHAQARLKEQKSVLDAVSGEAKSLKSKLGTADKDKLDDYLEGVRAIEKQIQADERNAGKMPIPPANFNVPDKPPKDVLEHCRIMMDLMILGFQTNSTRIITLSLANEGSNRTFPALGINEGHHTISHHAKNKDKQDQIKKIDKFYAEQLAYMLEKMAKVKESGGATLLDNVMIVYGSANGDGDRHNHDNLPFLVAGGGGKSIRTGQHVKLQQRVPVCNLFLSMMDRMGVKADQFGDSTGRVSL